MVEHRLGFWGWLRRVAMVVPLCLGLLVGVVSPSSAEPASVHYCYWGPDPALPLGPVEVEGYTDMPTLVADCEAAIPAGETLSIIAGNGYTHVWYGYPTPEGCWWPWSAVFVDRPPGTTPWAEGEGYGPAAECPADPTPEPEPDPNADVLDALGAIHDTLTWLAGIGALLLFTAAASMVVGWRRG